jgi:putative ABC transport system substrate-binding protein
MVTRRRVVLALGACALAPGASIGQQQGKLRRIGHLSGSSKAANKVLMDAFREGMRAHGHVEGQTFIMDERYAEGNFERLPSLIQELIQLKPDALLVATTPGNLAAKAATSTIPIVFVLVADPVGAGIVPSLARQGGNVTGVTNIVAELGVKRLELLKEIFPNASQIAIMVNPNDQNTPLQMRYAEEGARRLGIKLGPILEVRNPGDLEKAFEAASKANALAAVRMIDPLVFMLRKQTAALSVKYRLPMIFPSQEDVDDGGLLSYGANAPDQFRQAATMVDKILHGTKPAAIPLEQPTKFDLVINMKTAKALGIKFPNSIMVQATKVIE